MTIGSSQASALADRIRIELSPHCDRIEMVGALRMRMPTVASIDFVAAIRDDESVRARCAKNSAIVEDGTGKLSFDLQNGLTVNLHRATWAPATLLDPAIGNVGILMLIHTGTREFVHGLVQFAKDAGYSLDLRRGLIYGNQVVAREEEEIFFALNLEFIPAERRLQFAPVELLAGAPF